MPDPEGRLLSPEQRTQRAEQLLAISLGLMLVDNGWEMHSQPGDLYFQRDSNQLDAFLEVGNIVRKKTSSEAWAAKCRELGISPLPLCSE